MDEIFKVAQLDLGRLDLLALARTAAAARDFGVELHLVLILDLKQIVPYLKLLDQF